MKLAAVVLAALVLVGCGEHKPVIEGFHWDGDQLYDSEGRNVASVVVVHFRLGSSQACIFDASGIKDDACTYWETGQQAYDYIDRRFKERLPK